LDDKQSANHSCSDGPCCDYWFLHKYRSTFAIAHLQAGVDLRTVQQWMGHKDLASTMRYLKYARGKGVLVRRETPRLCRGGSKSLTKWKA